MYTYINIPISFIAKTYVYGIYIYIFIQLTRTFRTGPVLFGLRVFIVTPTDQKWFCCSEDFQRYLGILVVGMSITISWKICLELSVDDISQTSRVTSENSIVFLP